MTSKETAQWCHKCDMAIPDGDQMLCMGVKPIGMIDDVADDDCPKHRVTPEAPEPGETAADPVHHPSHYAWRGGPECIEIAKELCRGSDGIAAYLIGCAVKYIYRYPQKNGLQDLDKAIECLTMLRVFETRKGGDTDAR